jgi:polyisoprenoid-binding protein YceI
MIVPGESTARFELEEDLRSAVTGWSQGARITVVGTTDQVVGELALDLANLAATEIGEIRMNARTLKTDEFFRTRAIQNQILLTEEYEFITFLPTSIEGLPDSAEVGESVTFNITGDLTVRDTTLEQTFAVTATVVSNTQIEGSASTVIDRESYGLTIPNVANVTFVEEEVELYIDFIARTQ